MAGFEEKMLGGIASFEKSTSEYSIRFTTGEYATLNILNNHVFRYYMSPTGNFLEYPTPINDTTNVAKINIKAVKDYGNLAFDESLFSQSEDSFTVETKEIKISFNKLCGKLEVNDKRTDQKVLKEHKPIHYSYSSSKQTFQLNEDEYFFGGGIQNGRFGHKGEIINIANTPYWVDGGYTFSIPFYWSTKGYGVLRNSWQNGSYDFGSKDKTIETNHEEGYFDAFYFINSRPKDILNDYYELTGKPMLIPEYAFYETHINTYNVNYWYETGPDILTVHCGDNDRHYSAYKNLPTSNGRDGILGSLNGEKTKYDFSARSVIDWYKTQDMPLGWFVPNYESGYGQTDTFEGDLENLKSFVEYANAEGVQVALWSDGCLEPKDPKHPKKGDRDLSQELKVGVVAIKCNGDNLSCGLDVVDNAIKIFANTTQNNVRPFIVVNEGWAGSQRYANLCTGHMTGGMWEYIRNQIPCLIGAGLSGLPVIGSDLDGMYGGGVIEVNIREFQWKTFTPIQLNTEGWHIIEKMPFSFNCIESIKLNRAALKLRSMLLPYNYTICRESIQGLPMMRAMFLEYPKENPSYTMDSQYQFMWGPSILVAPVYSNADSNCRPVYVNSASAYWASNEFEYQKPKIENIPVRNGVYLPDAGQVWIDLFTGQRYQGGKIYNNIKTPLWKIPVFVKDGAIIPLVNANNNPSEVNRERRIFLIYPNAESTFAVYEDDGKTSEYLEQKCAKTMIAVNGPASNESGNVSIHIHKTTGNYENFVEERSTLLQVMASDNVASVKSYINDKVINIKAVTSKEDFENNHNVYYFDEEFTVTPHLEKFGAGELHQKFLLIDIEKTDVTTSEIKIEIREFSNKDGVFGRNLKVTESLKVPNCFTADDRNITATSITLRWEINSASFYEIERDENTIFSNIVGDKFTFKDFKYESKHAFRIRSVQDAKVSEWSDSVLVQTKNDPRIGTVENVTVTCSIPSEFQREVDNLTKIDLSFWITNQEWNSTWYTYEEMEKVTLSFDLADVYEIRRIEYVPREDAGDGTFLKIQYRHSIDAENWTTMSATVSWDDDDFTKVIEMQGAKFRYFELEILDAVKGYASGRSILFYKM